MVEQHEEGTVMNDLMDYHPSLTMVLVEGKMSMDQTVRPRQTMFGRQKGAAELAVVIVCLPPNQNAEVGHYPRSGSYHHRRRLMW